MHLFLELPAGRVLRAYYALKFPDLHWTEFIHVVVGAAVLPLFAFAWSIQFALVNTMDFRHYLRSMSPIVYVVAMLN